MYRAQAPGGSGGTTGEEEEEAEGGSGPPSAAAAVVGCRSTADESIPPHLASQPPSNPSTRATAAETFLEICAIWK